MLERLKVAFFGSLMNLTEKHPVLAIALALTVTIALMIWSILIVGEGNFLLGTKKIFYL